MTNHPDASLPVAFPHVKPLEMKQGWEILESKVTGYNTAVVMGAARARTGLLLSVLRKLQEFDPQANVDAANAKTLEDHATFSLLVRLREAQPSLKLTQLPKELKDFAQNAPEGWMMPVQQAVKLMAVGADRPGLLKDMCEVLDDEKIEVQELDSDTWVKFPEGSADYSGGTPMTRLKLGLHLPKEAVDNMESIRTRLAALGLEIRVK